MDGYAAARGGGSEGKKVPWKCVCGYKYAKHKTRHLKSCKALKQHSPGREQDPRLATTVSSVLEICGLPSDLLGEWDIAALDRLPNMRRLKPQPHAQHTPWYFHDHNPDDELLFPSVADALSTINRLLFAKKHRWTGVLWNDQEELPEDTDAIRNFTSNVANGRPEHRRMINLPAKKCMTPEEVTSFRLRALPLLRDLNGISGDITSMQILYESMNITPRATKTELHHDSDPHISITMPMRSEDKEPLKLWITYPSTEIARFGRSSTTAHSVRNLDHGSFLVQMPGDIIFAPPNSPHAVAALNTCSIYGISVGNTGLLDPTTVLADMRGNFTTEEACRRVLDALPIGLASQVWQQRVIEQFVDQWGTEKDDFVKCGSQRALLRILLEFSARDGSCVWCRVGGREISFDGEAEARDHLAKHCGLQ